MRHVGTQRPLGRIALCVLSLFWDLLSPTSALEVGFWAVLKDSGEPTALMCWPSMAMAAIL